MVPHVDAGIAGPSTLSALGTKAIVGTRWSPDKRRSVLTCRRGNCTSASRAHEVANARARSSSSASKSLARSLMRRGSIMMMRASSPMWSVSSSSRSVSHGSQLSMPSKIWPSERRSHCSRPHGSEATNVAAFSFTPSTYKSSRAGKISVVAKSSVLRWSEMVKRVRRSTSSPHMSTRTGSASVAGKMSTMAPRRANSPRCSTTVSRR
ncbi:unannotated protein [freshwater metagenome]|uniref:Unannotated protein n=1 Tax=freshwater metagenome TaxID=449393 RepID=A0A6J6I683_9ZZZZ